MKLNAKMGFLTVVISSIIILSILQLNITLCKADLESEKAVFLTLINQYRQQNGLPPLSVSSALTTAAQLHSEDMAINNYFSHTSLDGRTFVDRIRQAGYTYNTCLGENIAAGFPTAQSVFNAWKNSPSHNANMLSSCFKVIGIGLAYQTSSTYGYYWTTDFGGYDDSGGSPPIPPPTPPPPSPSINNPPSEPAKPSGPSFGYVNESYVFKASSVDPDGDYVSYIFDWGDGEFSTTEYIASGTIVGLSHSWSKPGTYSVRVLVKDSRGASSPWSSSTTIQITIPILEVRFTSNILGISINVDGVDYPVPKSFNWLKGTRHNVSLEKSRQFMDGGRYYFKGWSDGFKNETRIIIVNNTISLEAIYETQYLFSFKTQPGNFTSEWYAAGTIVNLSAEPFIVVNPGERLVFKGWTNNASDTTIEITVNEPGFIEAKWCRQFLLKLNSPYGDLKGGGWYDEGSKVNFSVYPHIIELENCTRRVFESWIGEGFSGTELNSTIVIRGLVNKTAVWRTEYCVMIETKYGNPFGAGWYNISSKARIFLEPLLYESQRVRHVFERWEGSVKGSNNNITITVDSPVMIKAVWRTEFYLNVSSEYGEVWGGGWYVNGSYASFGVKPPSPSLITCVFEGWEGEAYASSLNFTTIMDKPKNFVAKWRKDYTLLIIILSAFSIIPIIKIFTMRKKGLP